MLCSEEMLILERLAEDEASFRWASSVRRSSWSEDIYICPMGESIYVLFHGSNRKDEGRILRKVETFLSQHTGNKVVFEEL
jgi:hypothetical protein